MSCYDIFFAPDLSQKVRTQPIMCANQANISIYTQLSSSAIATCSVHRNNYVNKSKWLPKSRSRQAHVHYGFFLVMYYNVYPRIASRIAHAHRIGVATSLTKMLWPFSVIIIDYRPVCLMLHVSYYYFWFSRDNDMLVWTCENGTILCLCECTYNVHIKCAFHSRSLWRSSHWRVGGQGWRNHLEASRHQDG